MAYVTALPYGRPLTRADPDAMPDDGHRYELFDGVLLVCPAPERLHQRAVVRLTILLAAAAPPEAEVLTAPFDVALADDTVLQPDVLVAPRAAFSERDLPRAPLLAVEVLSPSMRRFDLLLKRDRLRAAGCPSYCVVDPDEPSVVAWELQGETYVEVARSSGAEPVELERPFALRFTSAELVA